MKKVILIFAIVLAAITFANAQSAKDTLKGQELEVFIEALEEQSVFTVEQERIRKEFSLLTEGFYESDSILMQEFNKTKVFYYFVDMEKVAKDLIDDSGDTLVVRVNYKEKDPVLKEVPRSQLDYNRWISQMKSKYLNK